MTGKIFINYRRGDDPGATGRLCDRLLEAFPPEQVFMDVDNIAPGHDFVRVLEDQVERCDVLLVVIGKGWMDARDESGMRRIDKPDDFVRIEIKSGLKRDKLVIPVLVHEARMPRPEDLPESIRPLARRNAVRLTHERFKAETQSLIKALQKALEEAELRHKREEQASQAQAESDRITEDEREREHARKELQEEEQARRDKEKARLTAISGLSPEQIARAEELANWEFIKESDRAQDFRDHLARFPDGVCERMARQKLASLEWTALGIVPDREALETYVEEFPDAPHSEEARARLQSFTGAEDEAQKQPLAAQVGSKGNPPEQQRFTFFIRSPRDFWGGLALIGLAIVAIWASHELPGQRGFAFGSGTAPRLFAGLLAALGAAVALVGILDYGPPIERYKLRGPALVIVAILIFAAMIRPLGLVPATFLAFVISILGTAEMRWIEKSHCGCSNDFVLCAALCLSARLAVPAVAAVRLKSGGG